MWRRREGSRAIIYIRGESSDPKPTKIATLARYDCTEPHRQALCDVEHGNTFLIKKRFFHINNKSRRSIKAFRGTAPGT
jgi:hypothetical protein